MDSDSDSTASGPKPRRPEKGPLSTLANLPYRRSSASLSNLFASTTSLPTLPDPGSPSRSGTVTPSTGVIVTPPSTALRATPPAHIPTASPGGKEVVQLVLRAFSPHVSVLASEDTEELIRHKGIHGGLLELLRPFGECVQGKVTIRDSVGVSKSWEDYAVRFVGVKDGLEPPKTHNRNSVDSINSRNVPISPMLEYKPARLRSGGDVLQVEELLGRHLTYAEEQSGPVIADYLTHDNSRTVDPNATSPFYLLYLQRLLSGLPMVPSETFAHPVASVIAISSRSKSPIEELRNLFASSNNGENRLPQWVHNEFLRYYVLIHDEDYDDIQQSMALYDQMKRHFGLHCHLLRLRSTPCVRTDDDAARMPPCAWMSASEELAEIMRQETSEDDEDPVSYIFESDVTAIRAFVREMVTQSIVPSMERASSIWNDQVASRRRGISGRFMSLSKRFTAFGSNRSSMSASFGNGGSNYDSVQGFYRPDAPEAIMRKLADYAVMLRDFKLAHGTYEILCQDFKNDKAWAYYAAANEMAAVSSLMTMHHLSAKVRIEGIDQNLEAAYYSYVTRVGASYNALRTLLVGADLLKSRGGVALEDAARWMSKILDDRLVGNVGHVLLMERIGICYANRKGLVDGVASGGKIRKAACWNMFACDAWMRLEKTSRAEQRLQEALRLYAVDEDQLQFPGMQRYLSHLQSVVQASQSRPHHVEGAHLVMDDAQAPMEPVTLQDETAQVSRRRQSLSQPGGIRGHRPSVSMSGPASASQSGLGSLGAPASAYESVPKRVQASLSPHVEDWSLAPPVEFAQRRESRDDGFE